MPRMLLGFLVAAVVVGGAAAFAVAGTEPEEQPLTRAIQPADSPVPLPPVMERRVAALQDRADATARAEARATRAAADRAARRAADRADQRAAERDARADSGDAQRPAVQAAEEALGLDEPDTPVPVGSEPDGDASIVRAEVLENGIALPPLDAPPEVRAIIEAGNQIARSPYKWGGGHGKWQDTGYDCSGSVSYALASAGLLGGPLDSGRLMRWGKPGRGRWITVWSNPGHVFLEVAGVRFDTSARRATGSRWQEAMRSRGGFVARHPRGL